VTTGDNRRLRLPTRQTYALPADSVSWSFCAMR
jgi:hypothetical protein